MQGGREQRGTITFTGIGAFASGPDEHWETIIAPLGLGIETHKLGREKIRNRNAIFEYIFVGYVKKMRYEYENDSV